MEGSVGAVERRDGGQDRILTNRHVTIVSGGEVVTADTINLGPGGMFVATDEPFTVGDRFICKIDLGEPYKPVLSGAEVRWVNGLDGPRGMGVRFLDIAEAAESLSGELPTQGPEIVKVRLESMGSAVDASVVERLDQEIVVELELPFLQPGARVEVGPNVAARTAAIRQVEWSSDAGDDGIKVRVRMDLEPSATRVAAHQVADEAARQRSDAEGAKRHEKRAEKVWQRPSSAAESEAARAEVAPSRRRENDDAARSTTTAEEAEARRPAEVSVEEPTDDVNEDEPGEREAVVVETSADVEEEDASSTAVEASAADVEDVGADDGDAAEDDELDARSFDPLRGALERVLGVAMTTRLVALWGRVVGAVKARINGPKLIAAWQRTRSVTQGALSWLLSKVGPAAGRLVSALRSSSIVRRRRRQARGEPSTIVRNLTDRARKVAAGRGKTIAVVLFAVMSVGGLGAVSYGLWGSANAEQEREQLRGEAARAGWSASQWDEPQPADSPDPDPS